MSRFTKGEKIFVVQDWCAPSSITGPHIVRKCDGLFVYCEGKDAIFSAAFCLPEKALTTAKGICEERRKLQKALDDSMCLVYQLNNAISRGEFK